MGAPKNWRGLAACATDCNVTPIDLRTSENMRSESLPDLGNLEREVMQLIWAGGPPTAEFIRERTPITGLLPVDGHFRVGPGADSCTAA